MSPAQRRVPSRTWFKLRPHGIMPSKREACQANGRRHPTPQLTNGGRPDNPCSGLPCTKWPATSVSHGTTCLPPRPAHLN